VSERARQRARSQGLGAAAPLLALQAQDPRAARLALRARGLSADGLVITWLMRGTLHLVRAQDVGWLHALFAPRMEAGNRRRLAQLGVSGVSGLVARIGESLPATRAELAAVCGLEGQAIVHVLARAAIERVVMLDVQRRFVPFAPGAEVEDPRAELGRRFGACHADAGPEDLAHWSGLPLRDARAAFVAGEHADGPVPLRLLGAFDELLLGWKDRTPVVPAAHARDVHPGGGILRPVVVEDGEAIGTWSQPGGRVKLSLWRDAGDAAALEAEMAAVEDLR
jgi:hypothetical protein